MHQENSAAGALRSRAGDVLTGEVDTFFPHWHKHHPPEPTSVWFRGCVQPDAEEIGHCDAVSVTAAATATRTNRTATMAPPREALSP